MTKIKGIISIGLQFLGVLFILCVCSLTYLFATGKTYETIKIKSADQINGYLLRAGLSKEQLVKIIFGSATYYYFMDDYSKNWCVEIKSFEISETFQNQWQKGKNAHPIVGTLRSGLNGFDGILAKCFEQSSTKQDDLMFFVLDIRSMGTSEKFQFEYLAGIEIMVYDPVTRRIAFYGYQI